jgi:hypothetical protein
VGAQVGQPVPGEHVYGIPSQEAWRKRRDL